MRKNAEKMDLSSCNRLLWVPMGLTHHMTQVLTLRESLYPWHSLRRGEEGESDKGRNGKK